MADKIFNQIQVTDKIRIDEIDNQWIVRAVKDKGKVLKSRSYCVTKRGLILAIEALVGKDWRGVDLETKAVIENLPYHFSDVVKKRKS